MTRSNPHNAVVAQPDSAPGPLPAVENARILVIDDELLFGRTLRLAFQGQHDVVVCTSGREALDHLTTDAAFDLVLCDLMMPDLTGMAVHGHIVREHPELADRVVFMTGGAFTDEARLFLEEHPDAQLEKPFDINRIQELLEALERRGFKRSGHPRDTG